MSICLCDSCKNTSTNKDGTCLCTFYNEEITEDDVIDTCPEHELMDDLQECVWCNEIYDESELRYEKDLGYLCSTCIQAIKSRGEKLIFEE